VAAIDGSGNSSDPTTTTGSLQSGNDTTAPSAPSQVSELSASNSTIRLSWVQSETDVASFNVFRALDMGPQQFLQSVTVPRATDTVIIPDETYCYQVSALDASGNESARSDIVCIDANDGTSPVDIALNPIGEVIMPDLDILSCNAVLTSADILSGLTNIGEGCLTVPNTLTIPAGSTLQLNRGAVLKFGAGANLIVERGASLSALGTLEEPVVFTGTEESPGHWGGIGISSNSPSNALNGVIIEYGGNASAFAVITAMEENVRFRMNDSLVRFNDGQVLGFNRSRIVIDSFSGNRIIENADVGIVNLEIFEQLRGNTEYIDNVFNQFSSNTLRFLGEDIVIPAFDIPINWGGAEIMDGSLTIEAGVELIMGPGNTAIDVDGPFSALGTAEQPITITGRSTTQGSWEGLVLRGTGNKTINYTDIEFGGFAGGDTGAIVVQCDNFDVQISNTNISGSASWGIFVSDNNAQCDVNVENNVNFSNNVLGDINVR